jgi:hypothetical protein
MAEVKICNVLSFNYIIPLHRIGIDVLSPKILYIGKSLIENNPKFIGSIISPLFLFPIYQEAVASQNPEEAKKSPNSKNGVVTEDVSHFIPMIILFLIAIAPFYSQRKAHPERATGARSGGAPGYALIIIF